MSPFTDQIVFQRALFCLTFYKQARLVNHRHVEHESCFALMLSLVSDVIYMTLNLYGQSNMHFCNEQRYKKMSYKCRVFQLFVGQSKHKDLGY